MFIYYFNYMVYMISMFIYIYIYIYISHIYLCI
jgi:hypothetical protein